MSQELAPGSPPHQPGQPGWSSAAQLMAVLDAVPAVITVCDTELRVRFANRYAVSWLGGTCREQLLGARFADVLSHDVYEANLPHALAALEGIPQQFQRSFIDRTGQLKHTQAAYTPIRDEAGAVTGFFVHVTDITDRVEAEMALREQSRLLAEMTERERIASSFGELLTRRLFGVSLTLGAALGDTGGHGRRQLEQAIRELDETLRELRTGLFPPAAPDGADGPPAAEAEVDDRNPGGNAKAAREPPP